MKDIWKKILAFLLSLNALLLVFVIIFVIRLSGVLNTAADEINQSLANHSSEQNEVVVEGEEEMPDLYQLLFSKLEKYGVTDQYQEEVKNLGNQIIERSLTQARIGGVKLKENGLSLSVVGYGINVEDLNESFIQKAAFSAAGSYLVNHFWDAAGALFKPDNALEKELYTNYGEELFNKLEQQVEAMPDERFHWLVDMNFENGDWTFKAIEQKEEEGDLNGNS